MIKMTFKEINKYIIEEIELAEEQGDNITIRLNLSDESSVDIWFYEENDLYTWSNATFGYEDIYAIVEDIMEWLEDNNLVVTDMESI